MTQSFRELKDRHKGRPAVILGAGPSLPGQLGLIPEAAVRISVNERPPKLVRCDYIVFCDTNTVGMVEGLDGEKISPFKSADYRLDKEVWFGGLSSSTSAAYIACYMGCAPVVLMGMDLYQGAREYFDDLPGTGFRSSASKSSLERHTAMWREALLKCPNPAVIKAAGGPLVEIFGKYEAAA